MHWYEELTSRIDDKKIWYNVIEKANDLVNLDIETDIQGYDIDPDVIKIARHNAKAISSGASSASPTSRPSTTTWRSSA